ncbi:IMP dehydrogenase [Candidatus Woesearchaeota archaeon]|nr:IMP dehydrogenase [Candidatus Woesearchaeota archaeon]
MEVREGLTFDDVLLVPKKSPVYSRKDVNTRTKLSKNIYLNTPIISANMDSVTESDMAIALAREGGIGMIHRFLPIKDQVEEVLKVKRSETIIIENPYTFTPDRSLLEAKGFMEKYDINGMVIVNEKNEIIGIMTARDILFEENLSKKIYEVMTKEVITAKFGISVEEAKKILHENRIEKLPLVDENNVLKGLITTKDIIKREKYPLSSKDNKGRFMVGAAIGVKDDYLERAEALLKAGADILVLDIAHGHSDTAISCIREIKNKFGNIELIAGNVATAEGAEDLIKAGADAIKVGVGGGGVCTTRIVTGSGVPQLTAIIDCAKVAKKYNIPVIADGGIKFSGDITKALAAGASTVMIGRLLAGTDESPGTTIIRDGRKYKIYRGMASLGANMGRSYRNIKEIDENLFSEVVPEGVESMVPYRGNVSEIIHQLIGGLRSGMSYCGAKNIEELQINAAFIKMSPAGLRESHPHDVEVMK